MTSKNRSDRDPGAGARALLVALVALVVLLLLSGCTCGSSASVDSGSGSESHFVECVIDAGSDPLCPPPAECHQGFCEVDGVRLVREDRGNVQTTRADEARPSTSGNDTGGSVAGAGGGASGVATPGSVSDSGGSGAVSASSAPLVVPPPDGATAAELFGLRVGARWTYLRSGDVLRWKGITACEDVLVLTLEGDQVARRTVRAYVRENRGPFGVTSVHYLVVDDRGVHRVRRDDIDEGNLTVFSTYVPNSPRLLNGPYVPGDTNRFALRTFEFFPQDEASRGFSDTSAVDEVLGEQPLVVVAGDFPTLGMERKWSANNAHDVVSNYAVGIGEVREETLWPGVPLPTIQIEELVDHSPGYGTCEPASESESNASPLAGDCEPPLIWCDDTWGTGRTGCTDPRVDPENCGGCEVECESGVCAGSECLSDECDVDVVLPARPDPVGLGPSTSDPPFCDGTTICCPSAWNWGQPGCTSPSRDRWNCGGCGVVCADGLICDHGECVCGPGTGDCGTGCRSVLEDDENCGECGRACGGDTPRCNLGVCGECISVDLVECNVFDSDGDPEIEADGAPRIECADLEWDNDHCGMCGEKCGEGTGTQSCQFGVCVTCDEAGLADCDGDCADFNWSDKHCGNCDTKCSNGDDTPAEVCVFGACVGGDGSCSEPCQGKDEICCDGECIDPKTSDQHCGGCNVSQCTGGCTEACRDGECVAVDCGGGDD